MNGLELINRLRGDILDSPEPDSLWTNVALLRNINEAEREVAIRTLCLSDTTTADLATVAAATSGWNALNAKILDIDDVFIAGRRLIFQEEESIRSVLANYETSLSGLPRFYTLNNNRIRFIPDTTGTSALAMTVRRLPLTEITTITSPEVSAHYELAILHYAAYLSYLLKDSQTLDKEAAATHLGIFTSMVGPALSAKEQYERKHKIKTIQPAAVM